MPRAEFPRAARLLRPSDYSAARARRQRLQTRNFIVEYWTGSASTARLGMAVSRRVSKLAVQRNRIRRQIRETFRHRRCELPNLDVLLIARAPAATHDNATLRADLQQIWQRLAAARH